MEMRLYTGTVLADELQIERTVNTHMYDVYEWAGLPAPLPSHLSGKKRYNQYFDFHSAHI